MSLGAALIFMTSCAKHSNSSFTSVQASGDAPRGVQQAAALWTEEDGTQADFEAFVTEHLVTDSLERDALFESLQRVFENLYGSSDALMVNLLKPTQLTNVAEPTEVDYIMSGYNPTAHLQDDLFRNKIAFITILNFPHYTLAEKNQLGATWTEREWAYARMGDLFTSRVPAQALQQLSEAISGAENYIADYNIAMHALVTEQGEHLWPNEMWLLSHWNLRDELKANYADKEKGQQKQEMIFEVMKQIVRQELPASVINSDKQDWTPQAPLHRGDLGEREKDVRYQHILNIFHAMQAVDAYSPNLPTAIQRNFEEDIQLADTTVERLFVEMLSSEELHQVAALIKERLGRDLRPYDIWYDGFKSRSTMNEDDLTAETQAKYPTPEAFRADMPRMLQVLGFSPEKALFLQEHIVVEPARGSGHAWPCVANGQVARLRTRIGVEGMNYKGYNIAVHEFGHNVEEVFDLYGVQDFMMAGIPNSAFTEASAFLFQARDLMLLGKGEQKVDDMMTLDTFWSMCEIMAVGLVDMRMWRWLYAHPDANAAELREAVLQIAAEVWNDYFLQDLGEPDCPILGIYSHLVEVPMYLPNYPIGHIANFQIESYLAQQPSRQEWAKEYERIYSQGRLTPEHWMRRAVGEPLSIEPVLKAVSMGRE